MKRWPGYFEPWLAENQSHDVSCEVLDGLEKVGSQQPDVKLLSQRPSAVLPEEST